MITAGQMRKLKSKEVRSLVKRFTATENQNQELTSPRAQAGAAARPSGPPRHPWLGREVRADGPRNWEARYQKGEAGGDPGDGNI